MIVKKIPILQGFPAFSIVKNLSFFDASKSIFLDIETNGLSSRYCFIYLIGILEFSGENLFLRQWLAQSPEEEKEILEALFQAVEGCTGIIHFNGTQFDLPFIQARCAFHGIADPLVHRRSLDLCRRLKPIQPLAGLSSRRFQAVEDFLGLSRKNDVNGKECIHLYQKYYATGKEEFSAPILSHNRLDLEHLPLLMRMLTYEQILTGAYHLEKYRSEEQSLLLTLIMDEAVPKPISYVSNHATLEAAEQTIKIHLPLKEGKLKKYFSAYKEYYYLPEEDCAIHKSVGTYVDKSRRRAATKETCYTWFPVTEEFLAHPEDVESYIRENLIPLLGLS
ncbi:MAG: ribonuclease H-like domain-containing protein [Blautia sp.]|jgi:uncharacterized protein YprB with RNaseH-like and TPR domain